MVRVLWPECCIFQCKFNNLYWLYPQAAQQNLYEVATLVDIASTMGIAVNINGM